jgi:hypothetical protein
MTNFKTLTDTELEIYISNPDALYPDAAKQEREARQRKRYQYGITPSDSTIPENDKTQSTTKVHGVIELERKSAANPDIILAFDHRTEISADARYIAGKIVKHMWVILVLLPFVLAVLYRILTAIGRH